MPASDQQHRARWQALAVGLVAVFMNLLDVSIVNVAVPSIRTSLRASPGDLQWVLSGYALALGLMLVPAGRFGDARGRRGIFVAGLVLFTLSSAAAGLAQNPIWLIVTRLVQGGSAGVVTPQVTGLIQQLFRGGERARPFGLLGATIGISTAVGPLLGGILIHFGGTHEGWRWVFYVNVPIGIVTILLGWRLIPARPDGQRERESPDLVGVLLLGLGIVLLLLPLVQLQQWRTPLIWLFIPAAGAVLTAFAIWELRYARHRRPLFDLSLFRVRSYALGAVISLFYFAGFTAIFFIFSLYLQNGLRYSPLLAGLAITPFALGSAASAALGGRIVNRLGRPLVAAGLALVALGLAIAVVVLHFVPGRDAPFATTGPLLLAGLGSGLVITPNQTLTLSEVPVPEAGSASGMLLTGQRIGAATGIAGVGSVFFAALAATHEGWTPAFRDALLVAIAFILTALLAALADIAARRRQRQSRAAHRA